MKLSISLLFVVICLTSCDEFIKPKETAPVEVSPPKSKPGKIDQSDSSYLIIKLFAKDYEISLQGKSLRTKSIDSIENFVETNNKSINKNKVLAVGKEDDDRYKIIYTVLKKFGIDKFSGNYF